MALAENDPALHTLAFKYSNALNSASFSHETVQLYPNPTNGFLNIAYQNDIDQIDVYTVDGKKIKVATQYGFQQAQLDASALANGIYILVLADKNNKVLKQKFVKK